MTMNTPVRYYIEQHDQAPLVRTVPVKRAKLDAPAADAVEQVAAKPETRRQTVATPVRRLRLALKRGM